MARRSVPRLYGVLFVWRLNAKIKPAATDAKTPPGADAKTPAVIGRGLLIIMANYFQSTCRFLLQLKFR